MLVFEISRMTNHNGPGIRTLVHFKGCPMCCVWCSTPESQKSGPELSFRPRRCIGDLACTEICPHGALSHDPQSGIYLDRNRCIECFACVNVCYAHALTRIGTEYTPEQLLSEIRKDELFFKNSGGGVTFSGGEPLMKLDNEMLRLFRLTREAGISIGFDTTGFVPWANIDSVLQYTDFFLWDLKTMDNAAHVKYTGVGNDTILQNLKNVERESRRYGTRVVIRCVQVPGMTDSDDNLRKTCEFLRGMKCIERIDLVNLHHLGKTRYEYIGRRCAAEDIAPLTDKVMEQKRKLVEALGFPCRTDFA